MRVLVCGSRTWTDIGKVWQALDELDPDTVIEGCARGADRMAEEWATAHEVPIEHYPANWHRFGPSAGPRRNEMMLARGKPDLVVAFSMGTKGTADMLARAGVARIPIRIFFDPPIEVKEQS